MPLLPSFDSNTDIASSRPIISISIFHSSDSSASRCPPSIHHSPRKPFRESFQPFSRTTYREQKSKRLTALLSVRYRRNAAMHQTDPSPSTLSASLRSEIRPFLFFHPLSSPRLACSPLFLVARSLIVVEFFESIRFETKEVSRVTSFSHRNNIFLP